MAAAVFIVLWLAAGTFPASAAQIREVKIHLTAEEFDEEGKPVLEADSSSEKYEVTDFTIIETEAGEEPGVQEGPKDSPAPLLEIELTSNITDGFGVMEQKDIRLTGIGGICVKAVRKDSGQTLLLTVQPGSTGEITGEIARVNLKNGKASWTKAPNASAYLLMLYKDSKRIGTSYRTQAEEYDFSPLIREAGIYHCKVFPLTESGRRRQGSESGWEAVDQAQAEQIAGELRKRRGRFLPEAMTGDPETTAGNPAAAAVNQTDNIQNQAGSGWCQTESGRYYTRPDNTYPQENWLQLDGDWYYFDKEGKMKANCWQYWNGVWYFLGETGLIEEERRNVMNSEINRIKLKNL